MKWECKRFVFQRDLRELAKLIEPEAALAFHLGEQQQFEKSINELGEDEWEVIRIDDKYFYAWPKRAKKSTQS